MPLDTRIATSGARIDLGDPVKDYANVLAIQGAQNQNALAQYGLSRAKREDETQNALNAAYTQSIGPDGKIDYGRLNALVARSGAGTALPGIQKARAEAEKTEGERDKLRYEIGKAAQEFHKGLLTNVKDYDSAVQWVVGQYSDPHLAPILSKGGTLEQAVKNIPQDPAELPAWIQKNAMGMKDFIEKTAAKPMAAGGNIIQSNSLAPDFMGVLGKVAPTASDVETARHNPIMEGLARRQAATSEGNLGVAQGNLGIARQRLALDAGDGKPLTEAQGNATGFGLRAREAADLVADLEKTGTFGRVSNLNAATRSGLDRIPLVGTALSNTVGAAGNLALTAPQQKYEQAKGDFKRAVLRKESGATISPAEDEAADRQYFPQFGDSDSVIEQKRKNRETAIESLKIQAGHGAKKIPPSRANAGAAPSGVDPKLWAVMTPEERKLWQ